MPTPPQSREEAKRIVEQWKQAAPLLEKIREEDIRSAISADELRVLGNLIIAAIENRPPRTMLGEIEMQWWFQLIWLRSRRRERCA